jgi:glycosyltransferase involved in cell wall biosynthesis
MAAIEEMAERLNISSYLEIMGPADPDQVSKHYLDATAMVLPSTSEPWGLVVNEALHFGCPVIISHKCGCAPEFGNDISCGMTFASGDINDLTDKMLRAIDLWSDVKSTAEAALALISTYSPANASENIISGLVKISSTNERF